MISRIPNAPKDFAITAGNGRKRTNSILTDGQLLNVEKAQPEGSVKNVTTPSDAKEDKKMREVWEHLGNNYYNRPNGKIVDKQKPQKKI